MAAIRIYRYQVSGNGTFPMDMLRHDCAWPRDAASVDAITSYEYGAKMIRLASIQEPTITRWSSFSWHVGQVEKITT